MVVKEGDRLSGEDCAMKVGSEAHKNLFCTRFIDSHLQFEPEQMAWPDLDAAALKRMREVPFWQEVLYTEMRAIRIIDAFSQTIADPLLRDAMDLMGLEEKRHERLVRFLIDRYGIEIEGRDLEPLSPNIERTFIDFGYGECVDSFLGFGFFKMARQGEFLPGPMFDILEVLMSEEIRHVLFFVNWMAYREAQHGRRAAVLRAVTSAWYYARSIAALVRVIVRNARNEGDGRDFSATEAGALLEGFTVRKLLEACLAENARRLDAYEKELLRPLLLPGVARIALAFTPKK